MEYNNLDIAIYKKIKLEYFRPFQYPIAIIEVKREEENLSDHENQLLGYLSEHRTSIGVLFNGSACLLFKKSSKEANFSRSNIRTIEDIPAILREALNQPDSDFLEFERARGGDTDSFVYLIKKYGKYALHKFTFLLKDNCEPILGCFFSYDQDYIYYDLYGKYSSKKKFSFKYHAFDRLISIIY